MDVESYYVLIPVPIGLLLIITSISYCLGLKLISSIGLGVIISGITIVVLHPFHVNDQESLISEPGDYYVSLYIIFAVFIILILACITICTKLNNKFCCKETEDGGLVYLSYDQKEIKYEPGERPEVEKYSDVSESEPQNISKYNKDILVQTDSDSEKTDYSPLPSGSWATPIQISGFNQRVQNYLNEPSSHVIISIPNNPDNPDKSDEETVGSFRINPGLYGGVIIDKNVGKPKDGSS